MKAIRINKYLLTVALVIVAFVASLLLTVDAHYSVLVANPKPILPLRSRAAARYSNKVMLIRPCRCWNRR